MRHANIQSAYICCANRVGTSRAITGVPHFVPHPRLPPPAQGSPIAGDTGAVSGIADSHRNQFNTQSRNRRQPTPPGEMAVNNTDTALLRKRKGKAPASSSIDPVAPTPKSIL